MAKNKKTPAKASKKTAKSPSAAKAKKSAPAKVAKKAAPKKAKTAAKKAVSKPATKTASKKAVAVKKAVVKKSSSPVKKAVEQPRTRTVEQPRVEELKAPAAQAAKVAQSAQLNFFQMPNQRPMAHKPAKPVTAPEDKTRYSEEELREFEELILRKLEKAREEYKILKDTLNRNNDEGTDATSGGNTKVLEDGAETAEKENLSQLAARQQKYISNLENALIRIKNGTYGICSVTGKLISKERLIAVPHTTQSIEAKLMQQD